MAAAEPRITLGELGRRLDKFEADMGGRFDDLIHRLDESVQSKVYEADQRPAEAHRLSLEQRIDELSRKDDDRVRDAAINRRLAISALFAPLLITLVSVLLYAAIIGGK